MTGCSVLRPSLPPFVGSEDDNDMDWVARGLSSFGNGSIVVSTLRRSSALLLPSGGDVGGGQGGSRNSWQG